MARDDVALAPAQLEVLPRVAQRDDGMVDGMRPVLAMMSVVQIVVMEQRAARELRLAHGDGEPPCDPQRERGNADHVVERRDAPVIGPKRKPRFSQCPFVTIA